MILKEIFLFLSLTLVRCQPDKELWRAQKIRVCAVLFRLVIIKSVVWFFDYGKFS